MTLVEAKGDTCAGMAILVPYHADHIYKSAFSKEHWKSMPTATCFMIAGRRNEKCCVFRHTTIGQDRKLKTKCELSGLACHGCQIYDLLFPDSNRG